MKAKREKPDEAPTQGTGKKKKPDRCRQNANAVASTNRTEKRSGKNEHFEQFLEKPCMNHGYPIKHKLKDCEMLRRTLKGPAKAKPADGDKDSTKEKETLEGQGDPFAGVDGCLVIIRRSGGRLLQA